MRSMHAVGQSCFWESEQRRERRFRVPRPGPKLSEPLLAHQGQGVNNASHSALTRMMNTTSSLLHRKEWMCQCLGVRVLGALQHLFR